MDVTTMQSLISNNTNLTCPTPLLWTLDNIQSRKARLWICIVAVIIHGIFWLQLVFSASVRQKSMQWIYAYLIADALLLLRFFFTYIIHTISTDCQPNTAWFLFICYFEAIADNYLNIVEVYALLALNVCRYVQIAYNRNVYKHHTILLTLAHISIYLMPFISLFIQFICEWTQVQVVIRGSCQVIYTNLYIQIFNIITAFALPIFLNILIIYASVRHIRLTSNLQRTQHHVSAREKYNRSLVVQFLIFYVIWAGLWSPNIIVFQVSIGGNATSIARTLNFIEIALDPIIIAALDVRFWQSWKKLWMHLRKIIRFEVSSRAQIHPITTKANAFSYKTPQLQTTKF
ncbi:unnamed protein product [Adineta steineri]|uniref:G-protein coupled receptors family 1 profile domain-containing protein n=2 Tax=Adineta steineri TaxID=433720 RepID=A0A819D5A6_9BILA|nr:unnamed protein product [Adineta steineri]